MKQAQKTIIILVALLIFGCSSMNSSFDCPNKPGVSCKSLSQVNAMVDRGLLGREDNSLLAQGQVNKHIKLQQSHIAQQNAQAVIALPTIVNSEKRIRIWVAPYQDTQNNYHEASSFYIIVHGDAQTIPKEVRE
jgi:conjugal transfer pilus assembly protein TraV